MQPYNIPLKLDCTTTIQEPETPAYREGEKEFLVLRGENN